MKKKILCAVFVLSSMCMNAFAAADVSVVDNNVTVVVDVEAEKWGTLIVTKSGASLADENIIAMKQAVGDENGKATFNFSMPEGGVNGEYDLHIKSGDRDVYVESMYYVLPADRERVADELKNSDNVKAVIENVSNKEPLTILGVHLDVYNDFKETDTQNGNTALTDAVCETFANARTGDMSDAEVVNLLNETLIIKAINELPEKYHEKAMKAFKNFDYISVREEAGKKNIEKL